MYTGGSIVFNTLNHDFSKWRHNYQPSVSSHAMSMTTIPTDGAIDMMSSKKRRREVPIMESGARSLKRISNLLSSASALSFHLYNY